MLRIIFIFSILVTLTSLTFLQYSNTLANVGYAQVSTHVNADFQLVGELETNNTDNGQFQSPTAIVIDSKDNIYVLDYDFQVQKFDRNGDFLTEWDFGGSSNVQQNNANDMAIDSEDNIYVAASYGLHIQKFDSNGNLMQFELSDTSDSDYSSFATALRGIATDSKDRLKVYLLGTVGGIAIDSEGHLEESPSYPDHIQYFDSEGNSIAVTSSDDDDSSQIEIGHHTAVNSTGYKFSINNDYKSSDLGKIQIFAPVVNSTNLEVNNKTVEKSLPVTADIGLSNSTKNIDISKGNEVLNSSLPTGITGQI